MVRRAPYRGRIPLLTRSIKALALTFMLAGTALAQGDGAPPMFPTEGKADQVGLIAGICGVQLKDMSPEACRCLAEQAMTRLGDPQRDYLVATAVSPPVADRMLEEGSITQIDQRTIFTFLDDSLRTCRSGTYDADAPALPAQ